MSKYVLFCLIGTSDIRFLRTSSDTFTCPRRLGTVLDNPVDFRSVGPDQDDWDKFIRQCEVAVNNSCISGTDVSPFLFNSGYHPKVALVRHSKGLDCAGNPSAERMNRDMQEALVATRKCLKRAQTRAQHYADKHCREEQFQIEDKVLLSTRNLKFRGKRVNNFMPKFIGPF